MPSQFNIAKIGGSVIVQVLTHRCYLCVRTWTEFGISKKDSDDKSVVVKRGLKVKCENGNVHHYVYYGCCRFHDKDCPSGYMREEDLVEQLTALMDKIDLDEIGMKERIKTEIERHKKFQSGLLGIKERAVKVGDIDIRNYAKYILRDGTIFEKREILSCLRSIITMAKKEIKIT